MHKSEYTVTPKEEKTMKKITKKTIKDLEKRLAEEQAKENSDIKRITFLKATINSNSKQLGLAEPYTW